MFKATKSLDMLGSKLSSIGRSAVKSEPSSVSSFIDPAASQVRFSGHRISVHPLLRLDVGDVVGQRVGVHRPVVDRDLAGVGSSQASVCFIQFWSSRSGKSSRAWAPRLSVRLTRRVDGDDGLLDQIVEFQRLDQVGVPDQRAVADADVARRRRRPRGSASSLPAAPRRCGTPRNSSASPAACAARSLRGRRAARGVAEFVEPRQRALGRSPSAVPAACRSA